MLVVARHISHVANGSAFTALATGGPITTAGSLSIAIAIATASTAGTYTKVTTDTYGRVKSGGTLTASDLPAISEPPSPKSQLTSAT